MSVRIMVTIYVLYVFLSLFQAKAFCAIPDPSEVDGQEFKQDLARIKNMQALLASGKKIDINECEKLGEDIQRKWNKRNKIYYAQLVLDLCGLFTYFGDKRRDVLSGKYALSALENADAIPVLLELDLTHRLHAQVAEDNFAKMRKKVIELKLHAWKRLVESIDPDWEKKKPRHPREMANELGLPGFVTPEYVKDPVLRAQYAAAIEEYNQYQIKGLQQRDLRSRLERLPEIVELQIISLYSQAPPNPAELKQLLENSPADEKFKVEVLNAVSDKKAKEKIETDILKKWGVLEK
jgi:hypothetical protein